MPLSSLPKCPRCFRFEKIKRKGMEQSYLDYTNMPEHDKSCPYNPAMTGRRPTTA